MLAPQLFATILFALDFSCVGNRSVRYSYSVKNAASAERSPTIGLLLGLVITLAAVLAYASYITVQLAGLRKLQSEMVDRNRKDSLQLLRVQNDLNSIALAMRDMLDTTEPYPLTAWTAQFERIRQDLDAGLKLEESLAGANRTPDQQQYLTQSVSCSERQGCGSARTDSLVASSAAASPQHRRLAAACWEQ